MAVAGYVILGLLGLLVALLCIPVYIECAYRTDGEAQAAVRWLFLRFRLYPPAPDEQKPQAGRIKSKKRKKKAKAKKEKREPQDWLEQAEIIVDLLASVKGAVGMIVRSFRIEPIRLWMVIAKDDAAQTAISYGQMNAAVYGLYAFAKGFLNLGTPDIRLRPDFVTDQSMVDFYMRGRLVPMVALVAGLRAGVVFLTRLVRRHRAQEKSEDKLEVTV